MKKQEEKTADKVQEPAGVAQPGQQFTVGEKSYSDSTEKRRIDLRKWWLVEIWKENREVFKALVVHTIAFGLLIEILSFLAHRIEGSGLPQERKEILEAVDFYLTVIALVVFGVDFITKLLVHFWRSKDEHKNDTII